MRDIVKDKAFGRILMTFVGAAAVATGCGTEPDGTDTDIGQSQGEISGGSLVSNVAPFNSVVKIGGCTATKIGARRFLTAGHCFGQVLGTKNVGFRMTVDNSVAGASPTFINVSKLYIHSNYDSDAFNVTYDAAVIDVTANTPAIPVLGIDTVAVTDGTPLTMVGYGCDLVGSNGGKKSETQLLTLTLAQLQALDPGQAANNPNVYSHFYPMSGGNSSAAPGVCPGDSGGPALRFSDTWRVAGINAISGAGTGTNPATRLSFETHVDDIASWITSTTPTTRRKPGAIINVTKGTCLSAGTGTTIGSPVVEEPCGPATFTGNRQFWFMTAFGQANQYLVQNGKTNFCLVIGSDGLAKQGECPSTGWLIPQFGTTTTITSTQTGLRLGILGGNRADAALAETNDRQKWLVIR